MLIKLLLLSLLSYSTGLLIIEPKTLYTLDLPEHFDSSINIKLEIEENGHWMTHNANGHNYLSIIVDPIDNQFEWYVPLSLTKYWKNNTRLRISNMDVIPIVEHIDFQFEGFHINTVDNLFNLDTINLSWETNSQNRYTLNLINENTKNTYYISDLNNSEKSYLWTVPNGAKEDDYYISINNNYLSNTFNIKQRTTSTTTFTTTTTTSTTTTVTSTTTTVTSTTITPTTTTATTTTITPTTTTRTLTTTTTTPTTTTRTLTSTTPTTTTITFTTRTLTSTRTTTITVTTRTLTSTTITPTTTTTPSTIRTLIPTTPTTTTITPTTRTLTSNTRTLTKSTVTPIITTTLTKSPETVLNDTIISGRVIINTGNESTTTRSSSIIDISKFNIYNTPNTTVYKGKDNCNDFCKNTLWYVLLIILLLILLIIIIILSYNYKNTDNKIVPNSESGVFKHDAKTNSLSSASTSSFDTSPQNVYGDIGNRFYNNAVYGDVSAYNKEPNRIAVNETYGSLQETSIDNNSTIQPNYAYVKHLSANC